MITITPTTASGLTHTSYNLTIKSRNGLPNLKTERPQSTSITLSGETVITVWEKKVSGTQFIVRSVISESEYAILRAIDEHTTVFSWVIMLQGRTFTATIDVLSALPIRKSQFSEWEVEIKFVIISEKNR